MLEVGSQHSIMQADLPDKLAWHYSIPLAIIDHRWDDWSTFFPYQAHPGAEFSKFLGDITLSLLYLNGHQWVLWPWETLGSKPSIQSIHCRLLHSCWQAPCASGIAKFHPPLGAGSGQQSKRKNDRTPDMGTHPIVTTTWECGSNARPKRNAAIGLLVK